MAKLFSVLAKSPDESMGGAKQLSERSIVHLMVPPCRQPSSEWEKQALATLFQGKLQVRRLQGPGSDTKSLRSDWSDQITMNRCQLVLLQMTSSQFIRTDRWGKIFEGEGRGRGEKEGANMRLMAGSCWFCALITVFPLSVIKLAYSGTMFWNLSLLVFKFD